ncbi:MAG TPA: hypothetical protein VN081_06870 [Dongiaceae bacterium]|nr:hypothetical protein [Dongiaceae bacterium]
MAQRVVIDYSPRKVFMPLHKRRTRWAVVVAHRRAGKTVACVNELIKAAVTFHGTDGRFAYVAPFYKQAKSVAWDYLKRFVAPIPGIEINESELRVDFPNGSRIQLFGADKADALRGLYFDGLVADEYGDWKPSVWQYVIRPALADRQGWAIIIGTPKGRNEFYERVKHAEVSEDWLLMIIRAADSGILPQSEMDAMKLEMTEDAWRQEMECDFDAALPGAFYGKEMWQADQDGRITVVEHDPAVPVHTAWDLGYSDDTSIWWYQVIRGEIHLLEYYGASGLQMDNYFAEVKSKPYKYGLHWLPHDAKAKTLASGGKSIQEMAWKAFGSSSVRIVPDLSVQDGIQAARSMLKSCWFDAVKTADGVESLKQYQREYDEDKKAFREKPRHDWTSHAADAFRMLAIAWREEHKPSKPEPAKFPTQQTINELIAAQRRKRQE